jgi:hypothetical protein
MDVSPKAPSKPRVTVYFVLPWECASWSSAQRTRRLQLSSHTSHCTLFYHCFFLSFWDSPLWCLFFFPGSVFPLVPVLFPGCSDHSLTTTTAPSFRALIPSSTLIRFSLSLSLVLGPVLLHYWLPLYVLFLFPFWRESTPPQGPIPDSSQPTGNPYCSLQDLQHDGLPEDLVTVSSLCALVPSDTR